jgi:mRNA-degrading endonuclease RelE of RelBE toxin-antitoxin system
METLKKFELMEKIVRELEDLQHSQQAIIQKIGKIEVDNIELGDKKLEQDLPDMHQRVADNLDSIVSILDYFASKTENFGNKNNVDSLKEQQAINDAVGK